MRVSLKVKIKRRSFPPLYLLKPSEGYSLFEERVKEAANSLDRRKASNRALKKFLKERGKERIERLRGEFLKLDGAPLYKKKAIYNAFYRIFQRLEWALSSGSEREVELKVWITSSLDYLTEVVESLGEGNGGDIK